MKIDSGFGPIGARISRIGAFLQNTVQHQQGKGGSGPGVDGCHEGEFVNPIGRGGEEWRGKKGREERRLNREEEPSVGHNSANVGVVVVVVHLSAVPREAHSEESEDGQTV